MCGNSGNSSFGVLKQIESGTRPNPIRCFFAQSAFHRVVVDRGDGCFQRLRSEQIAIEARPESPAGRSWPLFCRADYFALPIRVVANSNSTFRFSILSRTVGITTWSGISPLSKGS